MLVHMDIIATAITIVLTVLGFWWRIMVWINTQIEKVSSERDQQISSLHLKIDRQYSSMSSRLDNIWQHIKSPR